MKALRGWIPTCVILGNRKGELRPTYIIPVAVIFCEVDLKPGKREDKPEYQILCYKCYNSGSTYRSHFHWLKLTAGFLQGTSSIEEAPGFRRSGVDRNVSKGSGGGDRKQLSLCWIYTWRHVPSTTLQCPGRQAVAKNDQKLKITNILNNLHNRVAHINMKATTCIARSIYFSYRPHFNSVDILLWFPFNHATD